MRRISVVCLCAAMACAAETARRPGWFMSGEADVAPGIVVRYTTTVEPPLDHSAIVLVSGGLSGGYNRVHRSMEDKTSYFGYDLVVEPAGPNRYRVAIEPLSLKEDGLKPAPLPKYPSPQIVEDGDIIALDLLVSPDGRQKVVDYIEISRKPGPPGPATGTAPPRDFTLDDGPLTLSFGNPTTLFMNGQEFQGVMGYTGKPGGTLWLSYPGRGRYILSLAPHDGFAKAGVLRDNTITFQSDGDRYEYRVTGPIVGSGGAWNLYVLHDPLYQPKPAARSAAHTGTDRLENLLPRR